MNVSILARPIGVGIAVAAVTAASGASAQPRPIEKLDLAAEVQHINERSVEGALGVVTGNHIQSVDADGEPMLIATATNGLQFNVRFRSCEAKAPTGTDKSPMRHCKAMYMTAEWDALAPDRRGRLLAAAADFQRDHPAASTGMFSSGSPYVVRFVIADHGAIQGNLVSEFANFITSATEFQNRIYPLYLAIPDAPDRTGAGDK